MNHPYHYQLPDETIIKERYHPIIYFSAGFLLACFTIALAFTLSYPF